MTRDELEALAKSYAHKPELTTTQFDSFFDLSGSRLGRDLKSQENETALLGESWTTNLQPAPIDYGSMIALEFEAPGGKQTLLSRDVQTLNNWKEAGGGSPEVYAVRARIFDVRPFQAGTYNLYYFNRPALPLGDSSNAVSEAWPQLYLAALLVEVQTWSQDDRNLQVALSRYNSEVRAVNKEAEYSRGSKPAMRVIRQWA